MEVINLKIFFYINLLLDIAQSTYTNSKQIDPQKNNTLIKVVKPTTQINLNDSSKIQEKDLFYEIEATYPGGCGSSIMAKKRLLDSFQSFLKKNSINMKYKMRNTQKDPMTNDENTAFKQNGTIFDSGEFNLFLLNNNQKSLIGTSSNLDSLSSLTNPCLQGIIGADQDKCFKLMYEKIIDVKKLKS